MTRRAGAGPGLLLVLLGIWVGLIPFVGPYFNYQMQTTDTWHWTHEHLWLSVLPGAALLLGGLLLAGGRRASAGFGGVLAFAGGLWLVIGPTFAMLWQGGTIGGGPAFGSTGTRVAEWLGFYYAAGALGILLAGYAMGYLAALPYAIDRAITAAPAATAPAAAAPAGTRTGAQETATTRDGAVDGDGAANGDGVTQQPRRRRFLRRPLTRA
jgi:hypothetical protein